MGGIRRVLGEHAWQSGAQKNVDNARLDISHYEKLSREEIEKIERLANETVLANLKVETMWMPREKAEQLYGFRLYQGGVVPGREIRVVKTEDWEVEACGGTHCRNTGELGLIKILRVDRVQDGVERIIFSAGIPSLAVSQEKDRMIDELSALIEKPSDQLVRTVQELIDNRNRLSKELEQIRKEAMSAEAERLLRTGMMMGNVRLVTCRKPDLTEEEAIILADQLAKRDEYAVSVIVVGTKATRLVVSAGKKAMESGIDAGKLAKELAPIVGGSGGGKPYFGQGGGIDVNSTNKMLNAAPKIVDKMIRSK
jgi:alanyl-tRNA synthetase